MFLPGRDEFDELSKQYPLVPIYREVAADLETPVSAYLKTGRSGPSFLLESVEHGERWGRHSFIGLDPFLILDSREGVLGVTGDALVERTGSPLEAFKSLVESYQVPTLPGLPPFFAGAVGYLAYDCVRYLEKLPCTTVDEVKVPEMVFMFPRTVLAFDHLRQRVTVVTNVLSGQSYDEAVARVDAAVADLGRPLEYKPIDPQIVEPDLPGSSMSREEFEAAVVRAKEYILAGDVFQVVPSQRFSVELKADPFDVYRVLRLVNPSPYMFFINHPDITLIGSSPEPLVKASGSHVIQRPIAGTRPRGKTEAEDLEIEASFVKDEKERAEHVMLVDLSRNDLGRVCHWGSVKVDSLMEVERYSHVMHLVSQVSGELAAGKTGIDALYASFPAGTVSGAPKIRAMEIIDELEPTRRGPYAGIVGYFDFSGNLDTCIALRTGYVADGVLHVQAGAGIVADSDPAYEWAETVNKAKALLSAAATAEQLATR